MGKLDYIRENIGALTSGTIYSGLWTAVLESHWPNTYVAGMAIANFGFGFYGYNLLKESAKIDSKLTKNRGDRLMFMTAKILFRSKKF